MVLTIAVVVSFQLYWLKENWDREQKTLIIKTNTAFQAVVRELQAERFQLPLPEVLDTASTHQPMPVDLNPIISRASDSILRREIIEQLNYLQDRTSKLRKAGNDQSREIIDQLNYLQNRKNRLNRAGNDPLREIAYPQDRQRKIQMPDKNSSPLRDNTVAQIQHNAISMLYRVDSLQDSIPSRQLTTAYAHRLKKEGIGVDFQIKKTLGRRPGYGNDLSMAVVGFAHPLTYQLILQQTGRYLFGKILPPLIFSLFLAGVTILTFVILYRNLLAQRRLAEMKNDLISNISHELKTPIATVGVAVEALRNFHAIDDPQKTQEYLNISSYELQRLSLMVDKVLRLSLFERERMTLNKEPFDLKKLIEDVLSTMRPQFERLGADTQFESSGEDFTIWADNLHITSVLYNLIDNALKYSYDKPIIRLSLSHRKDVFELRIRDNGIGIPKEYKSRVFEKFFRVPTGNRHTVKGYGLGLSYVAEIVRRHMGFITVESELGWGSTFIIQIPVKEKDRIRFDDKRSIRKEAWHIPAGSKP